MNILILTDFVVLVIACFSFINAKASEIPLKFVDLSYSIGNNTIFYPGSKDFELHRDKESFNGKFWYSSFSFCMGEHGGTHLDAPYHFAKDGWTVNEIPPSHLIDVPATVIDVEHQLIGMESPGSYKLTVEDLISHEKLTGERIPPRSLVLIHTGWSKHWPNKATYLGYENKTNTGSTTEKLKLNFPGISEEAIKWLSEEREIVGIGIDSASVDQGLDENYPVHVYAASRQIYNLENVANLHLLLCNNAYSATCKFNFRALVLPLKIQGGTGAPTRIIAMV